ncbi:MAG: hypothetical protein Q8P15_03800 [Nanoarchaeota archaeon]|nr:hypothetical protein [Nanoarchaeota archaeon]
MSLLKKLLNKEEYFENLAASMRHLIIEIFDYLEIPEYEKKSDGSNEPVYPINRRHLMEQGDIFNSYSIRFKKPNQTLHSLRIGLYSIPVMNFLGIKDKEWRKKFFAASLCHDEAKSFVEDIVDKEKEFTERDMDKMKNHVDYYRIYGSQDEDVKAVIERHHYYRLMNSYPENPESRETPEIKYCSSRIGILDTHDAAATRKINGLNVADTNKVKQVLMRDYAKLDMSYNGDVFPKTEMNGAEFIFQMYDSHIFGRGNPLNPFEDFDSLLSLK